MNYYKDGQRAQRGNVYYQGLHKEFLVRANCRCQLDCLEDTPLGVPVGKLLEGFNWGGKRPPNTGATG